MHDAIVIVHMFRKKRSHFCGGGGRFGKEKQRINETKTEIHYR